MREQCEQFNITEQPAYSRQTSMAPILAVPSLLSFDGRHLYTAIPLTIKVMLKTRGFKIKVDTISDEDNRPSTRPTLCSTGSSNQNRRADDDATLSTRIPSAGAISRTDESMPHNRCPADISH